MVKLLGSEIIDSLFRTIENQNLHPEVIEQVGMISATHLCCLYT